MSSFQMRQPRSPGERRGTLSKTGNWIASYSFPGVRAARRGIVHQLGLHEWLPGTQWALLRSDAWTLTWKAENAEIRWCLLGYSSASITFVVLKTNEWLSFYHLKKSHVRTGTCKRTSNTSDYNHHSICFAEPEACSCQCHADSPIHDDRFTAKAVGGICPRHD